MKKIIYQIFICIIICNIMITNIVFGTEVPEYYIEGQVKCGNLFEIENTAFHNMVRTSKGSIYNLITHWNVYKIRGKELEKDVEELVFSNKEYYGTHVLKGGESPWSSWVIGSKVIGLLSYETIEYFGNKKNIQGLLAENKIYCDVKDYAILSAYDCVPAIIWVSTNKGYYYITFRTDDTKEEYLFDTEQNHFIFKVFNPENFLKLITRRDMEILLDGEKIENENYYATMQGEIAKVSLRTILEALGSEVTWDDEKQAVLFTNGEDNYMFKTEDEYTMFDSIQVSEKGGEYKPVFWSDRIKFKMIENRIVIHEDGIKYFAKIFGKDVEIDHERLIMDLIDMKIEE